MLSLDLQSPDEAARALAGRLRALRLHRGWSQTETAARAGMTFSSYKRFENTGEIALHRLLKLALVFDQLERLDQLFALPAFASLDQAVAQRPVRKRAPKRKAP